MLCVWGAQGAPAAWVKANGRNVNEKREQQRARARFRRGSSPSCGQHCAVESTAPPLQQGSVEGSPLLPEPHPLCALPPRQLKPDRQPVHPGRTNEEELLSRTAGWQVCSLPACGPREGLPPGLQGFLLFLPVPGMLRKPTSVSCAAVCPGHSAVPGAGGLQVCGKPHRTQRLRHEPPQSTVDLEPSVRRHSIRPLLLGR